MMSVPLIPAKNEEKPKILSVLDIEEDRHYRMVEVFKEWIKSQQYLPHDVDVSYLSGFLALCKDDLLKAKRKFEASIISRKNQSCFNYDTFVTPEDFSEQHVARCAVIMPNLTEDGYRVAYLSFPKLATNFNSPRHYKYWITLYDTMLLEDNAAGIIAVADYSNCTLEMIKKADLVLTGRLAMFMLHCIPNRLKHFHLINAPTIAKPLVQMIRTTLTTKLKDRLIIHSDVKDLKNYLTEELIPIDHGGTATSLDELAKRWEKYFVENEEWKTKLKTLKLRGEVPKEKRHLDPSYDYGTEGTFRNLQID